MILLDTQAAAWWIIQSRRLSRPAASAIRRAEAGQGVAIASVTLMELAQMLARREIVHDGTPHSWLQAFVERTPIATRDITVDISAVAAYLPDSFPSDPFGRLIAATAIVERMPLVTSDARIQDSGVVETIW